MAANEISCIDYLNFKLVEFIYFIITKSFKEELLRCLVFYIKRAYRVLGPTTIF